jgi:hypothetical protein
MAATGRPPSPGQKATASTRTTAAARTLDINALIVGEQLMAGEISAAPLIPPMRSSAVDTGTRRHREESRFDSPYSAIDLYAA